MNNEQFKDVVTEQFKQCFNTLAVKKQEYNQDTDDRLDQFKKIAAFRGKSPFDVLSGMMIKHTSSIYDCIDIVSAGGYVSPEMWEEKITDHIDYLLLLKALILDEEANQK